MKKIIFSLFAMTSILSGHSQNIPINHLIKKDGNSFFVRKGYEIYEIENNTVKNLFFGDLYDPITRHLPSYFLNFDVNDSLMISVDYINDFESQNLNPNRFTLVLKHPSFGDPIWKTDLRRFSIIDYLPANMDKFYFDVFIVAREKLNFYLQYNNSLFVYEVLFDSNFNKIVSFTVRDELRLKNDQQGYFNIVKNNKGKTYMVMEGKDCEIKNHKVKKNKKRKKNELIIVGSENLIISTIESGKIREVIMGQSSLDKYKSKLK